MRRPHPLPLRWDAAAPPPHAPPVAIPPARMAPLRGGRPLKRWRYVAAFSDDVMLCAAVAAVAAVGPARSSWWAAWDRRARTLHERTRIAPGPALVRFDHGGCVRVRDRGVAIDLVVDEGAGVESLNAHGKGVRLDAQAGRAPGCGPGHARRRPHDRARRRAHERRRHRRLPRPRHRVVVVGRRGPGGRRLTRRWNLVTGVGDGPEASERSVWLAGRAQEAGPVRFGDDLSEVAFATGERLRFHAEALRARHDRLIVAESEYRQPLVVRPVGPCSSGRLPAPAGKDAVRSGPPGP